MSEPVSDYPDVAPWPPRRYTAPLVADYVSAADPWLPILDLVWRGAFQHGLEGWQTELVRAVLEVCPEGHPRAGRLRFRQVMVSLGRQNGKSEIAAYLGILFLLSRISPLVIGIASSADQARIVYRRAMQAVLNNRALASRFAKATDTRGITTKTGGAWEIKAAKEGALQGLPIDLGVVDEIHLLAVALWTALVNGTGGRDDCLVCGITTAGDDASELLKLLYDLFESGDGGEQFGAFIWEAPEAEVPEDDAELGFYLKCANPAIASGRVPLDNVIADVRSMPAPDAIRYRLNRFVSAMGGYLPVSGWALLASEVSPTPPASGVVFAVDRTPDWGFATITASWRVDGVIWTEIVRSMVKPSHDDLRDACLALAPWCPRAVVVDGYALKQLGADLKRYGMPVQYASLADVVSASALLYSKVVGKSVAHPGEPLLSVQLPGVRRRNVGEGYRVSRSGSSTHIDAVMATVLGVYFADTLTEDAPQLYV